MGMHNTGVGDDVNILELEAGTVQTKSNGGKWNAGGKLDSIEAFFFGGRNQFAVHEDCRCRIGMKEVEAKNIHQLRRI